MDKEMNLMKNKYDDYPAVELVGTVALWGACYGTYCKESGAESETAQEAKKYLDLAVNALKDKIKELDRLATIGLKAQELARFIKGVE